MLMTDVGLTGADPLDITQSGHEPVSIGIRTGEKQEGVAELWGRSSG